MFYAMNIDIVMWPERIRGPLQKPIPPAPLNLA